MKIISGGSLQDQVIPLNVSKPQDKNSLKLSGKWRSSEEGV